jgi:hypothetical protein
MSPQQAAKEHCANWDGGACLGMYYKNNLSVDWSRHNPLARCLLADGKRCPYFEEIIIPMRMSRETEAAIVRADKKDKAVASYIKLHKLSPLTRRICPDCQKEPLLPRRRTCDACRRLRRRATKRTWKMRTRRGQLAPILPTEKGGFCKDLINEPRQLILRVNCPPLELSRARKDALTALDT